MIKTEQSNLPRGSPLKLLDPSLAVLKMLLNQNNPSRSDHLSQFLPSKIHAELGSISLYFGSLEDLSFPALFSKIDQSWYIEELLALPEKDRKLYLSCFEEEKRNSLTEEFGLTNSHYSLGDKFKTYLLGCFFKQVFDKENIPLPFSYLPKEKTTPFLEGTRERFDRLFFFLGLHDLAFELKHVINASILRKLEEILSPSEIQFLQKTSHSKKPLFMKNLNITGWNGDPTLLREVLSDRGIYRFGKTLSQTSPFTLWYILHFLPKHLANKIELEISPLRETELFHELIEQTLETWDMLN